MIMAERKTTGLRRIKYDEDKFEYVRDILGNEVFRDKETGEEYLIEWKKGKPKAKLIS